MDRRQFFKGLVGVTGGLLIGSKAMGKEDEQDRKRKYRAESCCPECGDIGLHFVELEFLSRIEHLDSNTVNFHWKEHRRCTKCHSVYGEFEPKLIFQFPTMSCE